MWWTQILSNVWKKQRVVLTETYLSSTRFAFAKQSHADFRETMKSPGVLSAIGYCWTSPNESVPGSLPITAIAGWIEVTIIFANEIVICTITRCVRFSERVSLRRHNTNKIWIQLHKVLTLLSIQNFTTIDLWFLSLYSVFYFLTNVSALYFFISN